MGEAHRLKLDTFRIGAPARWPGALRIGVTRRPPRGVPRDRWRSGGYFDVWLPAVAPSAALLRRLRDGQRKGTREDVLFRRFFDAYEREMRRPGARRVIELLASVAQRTPVAVGCFCEDERRCHRGRLRALIERAAGAARSGGRAS